MRFFRNLLFGRMVELLAAVLPRRNAECFFECAVKRSVIRKSHLCGNLFQRDTGCNEAAGGNEAALNDIIVEAVIQLAAEELADVAFADQKIVGGFCQGDLVFQVVLHVIADTAQQVALFVRKALVVLQIADQQAEERSDAPGQKKRTPGLVLPALCFGPNAVCERGQVLKLCAGGMQQMVTTFLYYGGDRPFQCLDGLQRFFADVQGNVPVRCAAAAGSNDIARPAGGQKKNIVGRECDVNAVPSVFGGAFPADHDPQGGGIAENDRRKPCMNIKIHG